MSTSGLRTLVEEASARERRCEYEGAAEGFSRLFSEAARCGDRATLADALRGQARVLRAMKRFEDAMEMAALSEEIARRTGQLREAARATNTMAVIEFGRQNLAEARVLYRRACRQAVDVGDDHLAGWTCLNLGVLSSISGDLREARLCYLESVGAAVRAGDERIAMMAYNNLGMICADLEEWVEARLYFERGIEIAERAGDTPMLAKLYTNHAEPLIHAREFRRAHASLLQGERLSREAQDQGGLADALRFRGMMARVQGDVAVARRHLEGSRDLAARHDLALEHAEALLELARLEYEEGSLDVARSRLTSALRSFEALGALRDAETARELLRRWTVAA